MGYYIDASNVYHGFLRDSDGKFTKIDVPGAGASAGQGTLPIGANRIGTITGWYVDADGVYHGFLRESNGRISTFDVSDAGTSAGQGTSPANINAAEPSRDGTQTRTT